MTLDAFEQLVSAWLDRPNDAELARQVAEACAARPEFVARHAEYVRLMELVRAATEPPAGLHAALEARNGVQPRAGAAPQEGASAADAAFEARLRAATALPAAAGDIDLRSRIGAALGQASVGSVMGRATGEAAAVPVNDERIARRPRISRRAWWATTVTGVAAAWLLVIVWSGSSGWEPADNVPGGGLADVRGVATARVLSGPSGVAQRAGGDAAAGRMSEAAEASEAFEKLGGEGHAVVRVLAPRLEEREPGAAGSRAEPRDPPAMAAIEQGELWLMISPPRRATAAAGFRPTALQ